MHVVTEKILALLKENSCWYETFAHPKVRTSVEASQVRPGYGLSQGAKSMIVKFKEKGVDQQKFAMLVIPGSAKFQPAKAKKVLHTKDIRFVSEAELGELTGGIESGGVPPFGSLFGLKVWVDKQVVANEKIIFNAGQRDFSIAMKAEDYVKLVQPEVVELAI